MSIFDSVSGAPGTIKEFHQGSEKVRITATRVEFIVSYGFQNITTNSYTHDEFMANAVAKDSMKSKYGEAALNETLDIINKSKAQAGSMGAQGTLGLGSAKPAAKATDKAGAKPAAKAAAKPAAKAAAKPAAKAPAKPAAKAAAKPAAKKPAAKKAPKPAAKKAAKPAKKAAKPAAKKAAKPAKKVAKAVAKKAAKPAKKADKKKGGKGKTKK